MLNLGVARLTCLEVTQRSTGTSTVSTEAVRCLAPMFPHYISRTPKYGPMWIDTHIR